MNLDNTTIKITRKTKNRLDNLKEYKRESYEEIINKIFEVLNTCKINPIKARSRLIKIDLKRKESMKKKD